MNDLSPHAGALEGLRVLVTGGAGYIGSHTLVELATAGCRITVIDNFSNSSPEVLTRVEALTGAWIGTCELDVRDPQGLFRVFDQVRPEAVIHFAGLKAVGESEEQPLLYHMTNVGGTLNLLAAMERSGCGRIVFSSSATVYGEPLYLPYDEFHPLNPSSVYGRTKMLAEHLIRDWARREGRAGLLLRYFNPVGAHESGRIGEDPLGLPNNLMPYLAQVAVGRREKLRIFGSDYPTADGTGVRDYIHVTDLARAHVAALAHSLAVPGVEALNIGTGQGTSVRQMLAAFSRAVGAALPYEISPRRPGDIAEMRADTSRAADLLGWTAERDIDAMCSSTWKWQSANPTGLRLPRMDTGAQIA